MQLKKEIMDVPIGVLLKRMTPTDLCVLATEAINQGLITGRFKGVGHNMKPASISIDSLGIN